MKHFLIGSFRSLKSISKVPRTKAINSISAQTSGLALPPLKDGKCTNSLFNVINQNTQILSKSKTVSRAHGKTPVNSS